MIDWAPVVAALEAGRAVVIPTDTVYGVAVMPGIPGAVRRLFAIKGRPEEKAIPLLGHNVGSLRGMVTFGDVALALAERFWPGALTMVLPRAPGFDVSLGDGGGGVAVRVPASEIARELLGLTGPLAVTSANPSGKPPAVTVDEARSALAGVDFFIDGGRCSGEVSTLVSLMGAPEVLRWGAVRAPELDRCLEEAGSGRIR